jgi:hypothetical protein
MIAYRWPPECVPRREALADHRALEHGVDARLELYTADTHVFQLFWSFLPEAVDALAGWGVRPRRPTHGGDAPPARRRKSTPNP